MRFLSVCSGLEGASLALEPLGWTSAGFAEIEAFPSAIIAARYGSNMPGEPLSSNAPPNFGDFTAMDLSKLGKVDLLIGGTPCQAFSIAGKRLSLEDARGNLTLAYVVLAHELARSHGLRNALWENVPGVLNTPDNAFGCFLGALVGHDGAVTGPHGQGWPNFGMVRGPRARAAWIVRDAQYFGLAQRRERVFVVADFGSGADPAQVLFEPQSLRGNPSPRRKAGERVAGTLEAGAGKRGGIQRPDDADGLVAAFGGGNRSGPIEQAATLTAKGQKCDFEVETFIAHSLRGEGFDASEDGTGRGTPIIPVAYRTSPNCGAWETGDRIDALTTGTDATAHVLAFQTHGSNIEHSSSISGTLQTNSDRASGSAPMIAVTYGITGDVLDRTGEGADGTAAERSGLGITENLSPTLRAKRPNVVAHPEAIAFQSNAWGQGGVAERWAVRRLTPTECERLQGVPDGHTLIPWRGRPAELCPDGPRYKALGNSWAVPCVAWIATRLTAALGVL